MKIVFNKSIVERIDELLKQEVYLKNYPLTKVDYIQVTESEALELYDDTLMQPKYPWQVLLFKTKIEKLTEIHNGIFMGVRIKVEGLL